MLRSLYTIAFVFTSLVRGVTSLVLVPELTGPHKVGTAVLELVDYGRQDPLAPTPQPRDLVVSLFYPTDDDAIRRFKLAPQFPPKTSAYYDSVVNVSSKVAETITTRSYVDAPLARPDLPLLLFSPGFGGSRLFHSDYAEELASYGWNIVTVDHPWEAPFVEYPDGRVVNSNLSAIVVAGGVLNDIILDPFLYPRVADLIFVLDSLANNSVVSRIPGLGSSSPKPRLRTDSVGVLGGSFGGAAAYQVMATDKRFKAGANFDGELFGPAVHEEMNSPFLFLAALNHNYTLDPSWREAWPHLQGSKRIFAVNGTEHPSFTDWPVYRDLLGDKFPGDNVIGKIGPINGTRILAVERAFTMAFFDRFLKESGGELLNGEGLDRWPEVTWIKEPPAGGLYTITNS
ncbi:platelet-activating factor acetylhydrolase [Xylariaceae sp. FL1651]|nr:platelet-activating factor acetylhydrolase [Xylariaceae sp. FL1651]